MAGNTTAVRLVGIKPIIIIIIMQEGLWLVGLFIVLSKTVSTIDMHIIFECTAAEIKTAADQKCQIMTRLPY